MRLEYLLTLALYATLFVIALTGIAGLITAIVWLSVGLYLVDQTDSRGYLADISFLVTWPFYVIFGK